MATLLFSALGAVIGGPLGGAIGALVGRQVDSMVIGGPKREGPRLKELNVTTSSYGSAVPRVHGRMRVSGTIIWATDLVEHKDKQGGGKGKPSVTAYSYSASLAVALSSRPLTGIGRIWADGNLLRGEAGDLKTGGTMRFHSGERDQEADPLLAAAEGIRRCPAYRGLAYVVFEDLQLGDFGNRIPALSFEVIADDGTMTIADLFGDVLDSVQADVPLPGVVGLTCEGTLADILASLDPAFPLDCDVSGNALSIGRESSSAVQPLAEAAISVADDAFGAGEGFTRKRWSAPAAPPEILRYYDVDRDFQPGLQRAVGRARPGQPMATELPVAMVAGDARNLANSIARRASWARQTASWRTAELAPAVKPGALVTLPDLPGVWHVNDWEWRESGVELSLSRQFDSSPAISALPADSGRANTPVDAVAGPTVLSAFELPWDGSGSGDTPALFAAASSSAAGWIGAALFVDQGDGQLQPLGPSPRRRAVLGTAQQALSPSSPHLFDRKSQLTVQLAAPDLVLGDAAIDQLAFGANRALIGQEIVQFARAVPLGSGEWQLAGFLRGRGGTESAIFGHAAGERFTLLDGTFAALDATAVGDSASARVAAVGLSDAVPVYGDIDCRGITRRPLSPTHAKCMAGPDGSLSLSWTRRARGAFAWLDGVDVPLHEQSEVYEITVGPLSVPSATWTTVSPNLVISASAIAALGPAASGQSVLVRQRGSYALSEPLHLAYLP